MAYPRWPCPLERVLRPPTHEIFIFDLDATSTSTPSPLVLSRVIRTDAEAIAHYALKVAPEAAIAEGSAADRVLLTIRRRLASWWPEVVIAD